MPENKQGPDKKQGIDKDLIRDLAALLTETELSEIEIEQDNFRIRVARGGPPAPAFYPEPQRAAATPASPGDPVVKPGSLADPARHPGCVPSPMVGTAYRSPEPGATPYVEVGDVVTLGQTILIVEAMKHMNEVGAPHAGTVVEILVGDGQPVEYGEPLMIIE
ncbi:MAG: acetyl-CoA carboxylase biotin carboxyl carrier protein [Rhizobiales bacterium]|nr:acetyl-CoA carboxylase biotin carboxyl carrier protein [Hyphomicrobiales bacterium]